MPGQRRATHSGASCADTQATVIPSKELVEVVDDSVPC
jgi:hypothetical protein